MPEPINVSIIGKADTNNFVTEDHFAANIKNTRNTETGVPTQEFEESLRELGATGLRYPAGQPDLVYADGLLIDGELPEHLTNFLDWAREQNTSVVIVTPTFDAYTSAQELEVFAERILQDYAEIITAFEIGNEYWGTQGESAYGEIADESVLAIERALESTETDVDIWVQMANPVGRASDFGPDYGGFISRILSANEAIIDELSLEAREAIDGVVEHYYFNDQLRYLGEWASFNDQTNFIELDYGIWTRALGDELTLNITEWNIKATNLYQLGLRQASTMITQFEFMMEIGVDTAYVWPPQHSTTNDLAGAVEVSVCPVTGIVTNSIGGAVFDMMSTNLVGLEYIASEDSFSGLWLDTHVYRNDERAVVYVTSRSEETESISFHLGDLFPAAELTSATVVGYDPTTSDGRMFSRREQGFVSADSILIDGRPYYLNEHDAAALITPLEIPSLAFDIGFQFELQPFEVIQLTYEFPSEYEVFGSARDDRIVGSDAGEIIRVFGGDDDVIAGRGDDRIVGGTGRDHIVGGAGDDSIFGNTSLDTIYGGEGDDFISGGDGVDSVQGGEGNDTIYGRSGWDFLDGREGNDSIYGSEGDDTLNGYLGDDWLSGGSAWDVIFGGDGDDTLYGNFGSDVLSGGTGNDEIYGGSGDDSLRGMAGNDTLLGMQGIDRIDGGAGDDLLRGGTLRDTFVFNVGHDADEISDFEDYRDILLLSSELVGGLTDTNAIVEVYGEIRDDMVFFDFGGGDTILVSNLSTLEGLEDQIRIF